MNYGVYTTRLFKENRLKPTIGKVNAGDHPPITPLVSLEQASSILENNLQKKVYDLLARHYLALFGRKAKELRIKLKISIKDELFTSRIVSLTESGFYEIAPFLKKSYQSAFEIEAKELPVNEILLAEKATQPPPHYTDTTLLKLMEREHLGTKSTRPTIIKILLDRKLTYNIAKNRFKITEWGKFLIQELIKVWLPFLKPEFTRFVENLLEDVKEKRKTKENVVATVKKIFLALFDKFRNEKISITFKFDSVKDNLRTSMQQTSQKKFPQTTSKCPTCKNHSMKLVTTSQKKRFLACSDRNCKTYLSVPKTGRITILKNTNCLKCGFNVFKILKRKNNKSHIYYICPKCWNDSFKEEDTNGFCSNCANYQISKEQCVKRN
jgi:ssDNA-binding Zn-finger/Zn-ribbon topoisomerase 1